jgi:hypothetical protein
MNDKFVSDQMIGILGYEMMEKLNVVIKMDIPKKNIDHY